VREVIAVARHLAQDAAAPQFVQALYPETLRPQVAQIFRPSQLQRFVGRGQGGLHVPLLQAAGGQVRQDPAPVPGQADPGQRSGRGVQVAATGRRVP